ncbi:MAG: methyltransferase domain-containing protein [Alphaproteobacteria bacterium]|nr:methyltransferase domain-containing protein [Alphaproteobacteria bacterium]
MRQKFQNASSFIKKMVKSPQEIGAVMPSGKNLCRSMAQHIGVDENEIYVEVGVGTGVMTRALVEAGIPQENLYLFESEEGFIAELKEKFPKANVIHGDAQFLQKYLCQKGIGKVSKIVSSLPFKSLPKPVAANILEQFDMILKPNGKIVQFTYAVNEPYPRSFKNIYGFTANRKNYIAKNIPPATVWLYTRSAI